ncbi:unnamed protein product [Vitrella brassicaformis CCMP3155]|uniref:Uncharacterized protein n=1 Tax=Vitrella brassicaformis (strain CCMP3155) TaxID=1169540 RepID=A0A0G4FRI9_VITBC|nr:unnamed protein product [Vitrella brassicaformis CCMP3155]|eukprot:CEM16885.1 unnamed protein product [Vitrella brassicaformis CCMP3155]
MAEPFIAVGIGLWQGYVAVKLLRSTANIVNDVSSGNLPRASDVVRVLMAPALGDIDPGIDPPQPVVNFVANAAAAVEEEAPGLVPQIASTGAQAAMLHASGGGLDALAGDLNPVTDFLLTHGGNAVHYGTQLVLQNQEEVPFARWVLESVIEKGFQFADWDKVTVQTLVEWTERSAAAGSASTTTQATPLEMPGLQTAWILAFGRAKNLFDIFDLEDGSLCRHHLVRDVNMLTDEQFDAWAAGKESIGFARCVAVMLEMVIMCSDMCAVCNQHLLDGKAVAAPCKPGGEMRWKLGKTYKHYQQTAMGWVCAQCDSTLVLTKAAAGTMCGGCSTVVASGEPVYHCVTCPNTLFVGVCTRCEAAQGFVRTCPEGHHLVLKDACKECNECHKYTSKRHRCSVCEYNLCQSETCIRPNRSLNSS